MRSGLTFRYQLAVLHLYLKRSRCLWFFYFEF